MSDIKYIVIHCADTPNNRDVTAGDIHRWHKERGWDGIGYHFVVRRSGLVEPGRPPYWSGAHVKGHNSDSIGICLAGRDLFTSSQWAALHDLSSRLADEHGAEVVGHCDLDPGKTCPNFDVKQWWAAAKNGGNPK